MFPICRAMKKRMWNIMCSEHRRKTKEEWVGLDKEVAFISDTRLLWWVLISENKNPIWRAMCLSKL